MAERDHHAQMALRHLDLGLLFAQCAILFYRHNRVTDGEKNKAAAQRHYGLAQEHLNQANPTIKDRVRMQQRMARLEKLLKSLPSPA